MLLGRSAVPSLRYTGMLLGRLADPSLRYTGMLLGRSATNKQHVALAKLKLHSKFTLDSVSLCGTVALA